MNFDGNTFLIINKKYPHAKLAQWGTGGRDMGTYEQKVHPDQLWTLRASPQHPEYFYIYNAKHDNYRIAKWGSGDESVGTYNGQFYDDQLWKFVSNKDGYYRIYNYKYKEAKMAKWGKGDGDWGTYSKADYEDQLWKLVPRFEAKFDEVVIWSCDNRQGSQPLEEEIEVTQGLKVTTSQTISTKVGFKYSLKASINSVPMISSEVTAEMYAELETSLSRGEEKSWSMTRKRKFSAPAGKNYRVKQYKADFTSPIQTDNCSLRCKYKVEETKEDFTN